MTIRYLQSSLAPKDDLTSPFVCVSASKCAVETIHLHGNIVNMTANDTMYLSAGNSMVIKSKRVELN